MRVRPAHWPRQRRWMAAADALRHTGHTRPAEALLQPQATLVRDNSIKTD